MVEERCEVDEVDIFLSRLGGGGDIEPGEAGMAGWLADITMRADGRSFYPEGRWAGAQARTQARPGCRALSRAGPVPD